MTSKLSGSSGQMLFQCIAFDAVGTLIYPKPPVAAVYRQVARKYGSQLAEPEIERRFRAVFRERERTEIGDRFDWNRSDRLQTSEEHEQARWREIVARVIDDVADPAACFAELFEHFARPDAWSCFADVAEALLTLQRCGLRIAIATNFDGRFERIRRGLSALEPVNLSVISSVVGYRKPSLHFFRALTTAAGCEPEQILLVGDDEENDVLGGRAAGLQVLRLRRVGGRSSADEISSLEKLATRPFG